MVAEISRSYSSEINMHPRITVGGLDDLVYHLHGYNFHVVGARQFGQSMPLQEVKKLDARGQLFSRNLDCAPTKDTVIVPKFGAVALRFKADNPGKFFFFVRLGGIKIV